MEQPLLFEARPPSWRVARYGDLRPGQVYALEPDGRRLYHRGPHAAILPETLERAVYVREEA